MSSYNLERLLTPRSLAVIGASSRSGSVGSAVLANLRAAGFPGQVGVVNPHQSEVHGMAAVPSLARLPFVPDLAVISAPARTIADHVAEAGRIGVGGCIIVSAGLGYGQGSIAAEVEAMARAAHLRLIGPNCIGVVMPRAKLNASFCAQMALPGDLALISQSGAIVAAMIDWGRQRSVGF